MKSFFRSFLATLLAIVAASLVFFVIALAIFAGAMSSFSGNSAVLMPNSVLTINMDESISDAPASDPMSVLGVSLNGGFSMSKSLSMLQVLSAIESAKTDDYIKGIYIYSNGGGSVEGTAQMEELRNALLDFKSSGKFIVSYNSSYSQGQYWMASVADKVYLNPEGEIDWRGLASSVVFYKGLIDKLGVDVDIIRHGSFKSAVEPYMTDKMSPANRLQMETLVGSLWGALLSDISVSRNITTEQLQEYAENLALVSAEDAKELGFVDDLLYEDQVNKIICSLIEQSDVEEGAEAETDSETMDAEDFGSISLGDYVSVSSYSGKKISKNKVAVIYASGQIFEGKGATGVTSNSMMELLKRARVDDNVKAVVLRINSPGGSALASEEIWREVSLLREEKPVIVSMSCYAASGGYFISSPADVILADKTTLTGSIGVFGVMMSVGNALKTNLGITTDVAKTAPSADMGSGFRPLQSAETEYMTKSVEKVYKTFVGHVAAGRNMTEEAVDKIGGGRVWSGEDALEIGLADGIGGLKDAIALAADRAGVAEDFRVTEILPEMDSFTALMQQFSAKISASGTQNVTDKAFSYYRMVENMLKQQGVQAMMPYFVEIY